MKILNSLILCSLASSAFSEVAISLSNDDWPFTTKDNGRTGGASLSWKEDGAQFVLRYDLYTNASGGTNSANRVGSRVDELFFGMTGEQGIGVAAIIQGDLAGDEVQSEWHRWTKAPQIDCEYDLETNLILGGLWFCKTYSTTEYLDIKVDTLAHFQGVRGDVALEYYSWPRPGIRFGIEAFARGWFEDEHSPTLENYHDKAGHFGVRLSMQTKYLVFTHQFAAYDTVGTIAWRF